MHALHITIVEDCDITFLGSQGKYRLPFSDGFTPHASQGRQAAQPDDGTDVRGSVDARSFDSS
jgi:hypothetical protein